MTQSVFAAILGVPNVGKSTLLNRLVGEKIAIVSPKPQTTRTRVTGVVTDGETQFVFLDTPGIHKPRTLLGEGMIKTVGEAASGVDAALLLCEPQGAGLSPVGDFLERLKKSKVPVILCVNKIDTLREKGALLPVIAELSGQYDFEAVLPISAVTGEGVDELKAELEKLAVPSPHFFPDDAVTDQPDRVIAAELIREKLLLSLEHEIPHGIAVEIEQFSTRDNGILDISAIIYCEKDSHKGIIIGKNGSLIKKAMTAARLDCEAFFGCKVNLQTRVKVKENWRNRAGFINSIGMFETQ
ncbi:MAG: GTPase Era [Clostridia bacterium]|nr:GTPase Era [Clostridia bacterium]